MRSQRRARVPPSLGPRLRPSPYDPLPRLHPATICRTGYRVLACPRRTCAQLINDQTIYGWRLADVRRVFALAAALPGLRRVDLVTNYRCPAPVVERAVRLIGGNRERFAKGIRPRDGATGRLALAPDGTGGLDTVRRFMARPLPAGGTRAVLARTNRELAVPAAIALELGVPFQASGVRLLLEDPRVAGLLDQAARTTDERLPLLIRLGQLRDRLHLVAARAPQADDDAAVSDADLATALLAWGPAAADLAAFRARVAGRREQLAALRRDDAPLVLSTAHATKGWSSTRSP